MPFLSMLDMLMILAEERAMRVEAEKMSFMVVVVELIFRWFFGGI